MTHLAFCRCRNYNKECRQSCPPCSPCIGVVASARVHNRLAELKLAGQSLYRPALEALLCAPVRSDRNPSPSCTPSQHMVKQLHRRYWLVSRVMYKRGRCQQIDVRRSLDIAASSVATSLLTPAARNLQVFANRGRQSARRSQSVLRAQRQRQQQRRARGIGQLGSVQLLRQASPLRSGGED